jgi:hypothetical protein
VREPAVDQWETGELIPTDEQLALLGDLAGLTVRWFYRDDPPEITHGFICRRSGRGKGCEVIGPKVYPYDFIDPAVQSKLVPLVQDTLW